MVINLRQAAMLALTFSLVILAQKNPVLYEVTNPESKTVLEQQKPNEISTQTTQNETWPLPASLENKNIYYEHIPHVKGWSCGFNCLINAARIELREGLEQKHSEMVNFEAVCRPYATTNKIKTTDGASNRMLVELAPMLDLQPTTFLDIIDGNISYYNPAPVQIIGVNSDDQDVITQKLKEAYHQRTLEHLAQLKKSLYADDKLCIYHFLCHIVSKQEHVILISLVRNNEGMKWYVRDNMNKEITPDGQVKTYLEYLSNYFAK